MIRSTTRFTNISITYRRKPETIRAGTVTPHPEFISKLIYIEGAPWYNKKYHPDIGRKSNIPCRIKRGSKFGSLNEI